jgi:Glycosyl hydrolases family 2/Glycosyl hydrolases family 2, TIM barrel domain
MHKFFTSFLICFTIVLNAASLDSQGFIKDWLIIGPFPNDIVNGARKGLDTDFLNGENNIKPQPEMKMQSVFIADKAKLIAGIGSTNEWGFSETKKFDIKWKEYHSKTQKIILDKMFNPIDDQLVIYAACYIESPSQQKVKLRVGSDDDHKIWLNGKVIGQQKSSQAIIPDNFIYPVMLKRGINRLLLKVVDRTHGFGYCIAISDENNKAVNNLKIYTDDPARKFNADAFNNGFAAKFTFAKKNLFAGDASLKIKFFAPQKKNYTLKLKNYFSQKFYQTFTVTGNSELDAKLKLNAGKNVIALEVWQDNKLISVLQESYNAYSIKELKEENRKLKLKLIEINKELPLVSAKSKALEDKLEKAKINLKQAYSNIEKKYSLMHKKAASSAKKSTNEILPLVATRSRICLNGNWEASYDRKQWSRIIMPFRMLQEYFRTWYYPLKKVNPKNHYGAVKSNKGWEDFKFNKLRCAKNIWFKKTFNLKNPQTGTFICENITGKVKVYMNGVFCGEYNGHIGIVEIALKNLKNGINTIELFFSRPRELKLVDNTDNNKKNYGVMGDIFIDLTSPVRVADVWVKTSWRKAMVSTISEIENRTTKKIKVKLEQYIVLNNKIKLRLPEIEKQIAPRCVSKFENKDSWADPEIWGIGGKYGKPVMYEMLTDIYIDGKLVDRHSQSFGFREFWINVVDFYLNGKRIILQGDVAGSKFAKSRDVSYPLLRKDGINTLRVHGHYYWSAGIPRTCDRYGMLYYAQMYPILWHGKKNIEKFSTVEQWLKTETHQYNLANYKRWFKMIRNNPSVVIWSTDNEIFTQSWDTLKQLKFNLRNDKIGAIYEKYVKSLDNNLVMTRNGDIGTMNSQGKWFENPPCDTANYHYPEFNISQQVVNWQDVYGYRPVIFGETLYYSYGAWDNYIGPIPSQVLKKAKKVRQIAGLYRKLGIPGQIYMGLMHDGFIGLDNTGKGNPWGITANMVDEYKKTNEIQGIAHDKYPWFRIDWPANSGRGDKNICANITLTSGRLNWFDSSKPSHIRNAVNDAYRDSLIPQPELAKASDAECIIYTVPDSVVWSESVSGKRYGVITDSKGRAWFQLSAPGAYKFEANGHQKTINVPDRKNYASKPGFDQIPKYKL